MCWYTGSKSYLDCKTAEEDIPVTKILQGDLKAPFQSQFSYELNKNTPPISLTIKQDEDDDEFTIRHGYHSYKFDTISLNLVTGFYHYKGQEFILCNGWKLFHAVIPRGSKYYINEGDQCVSESLRIIREYDDDEIIDELSSVKVLVSPNLVKKYSDCSKDEIKNAIGISVNNNDMDEYKYLMINIPPQTFFKKEINQDIHMSSNNSHIHYGVKRLLKKYFDYDTPDYVWVDENAGWLVTPDYRLTNINTIMEVEDTKNIKGWTPFFCNEQCEVFLNNNQRNKNKNKK